MCDLLRLAATVAATSLSTPLIAEQVTKVVEAVLIRIEEKGLLLKRISDPMHMESQMDAIQTDPSRQDLPQGLIQSLGELVDTERKYVQDLEAMQDFMRAIIAHQALSQDDIHGLFLNLNALLDFQRKFLIGVETQNSLPWDQQRWGVLFIKNVRRRLRLANGVC